MPTASAFDDPVARRQPQLAERRQRRPAVIGQVVQRQDHGRPAEDGVVLVPAIAEDRRRARMPVVDMDDVDRSIALGPQRLEGRPAEEPEAPGVVAEVAAAGRAVEAVAVEGRGMVDESQSIAVCLDVDDVELDRAVEGMRVRYPERRTRAGGRRECHGPVAREEHVDHAIGRSGHPGEGACQRVDDIAEAAGLRPGLAFRGDERNAHRHPAMVATGRARYRTVL